MKDGGGDGGGGRVNYGSGDKGSVGYIVWAF